MQHHVQIYHLPLKARIPGIASRRSCRESKCRPLDDIAAAAAAAGPGSNVGLDEELT
ncbi:Hypothetical predicted protein [Scomber scombrus]|uniref:Uncharacterized protein n=1 Tax=Scomber scombrus TaxID=13677 RepID=A0AAV1QJG6_SCOSC